MENAFKAQNKIHLQAYCTAASYSELSSGIFAEHAESHTKTTVWKAENGHKIPASLVLPDPLFCGVVLLL